MALAFEMSAQGVIDVTGLKREAFDAHFLAARDTQFRDESGQSYGIAIAKIEGLECERLVNGSEDPLQCVFYIGVVASHRAVTEHRNCPVLTDHANELMNSEIRPLTGPIHREKAQHGCGRP
jgi:hypothetical protein